MTTTSVLENNSTILYVCSFHIRLYELRWDRGVKCYSKSLNYKCGEGKNDPIFGNVLLLVFRSVWRFQKTKSEVEIKLACENIRPENLANIKSFLKYSVTLTFDFVFGKLSTN